MSKKNIVARSENSTLYEVLKNGEPVFATTSLEQAKQAYYNRIGEDKEARYEVVEVLSSRSDYSLKKLLNPNKRHLVIMYTDPFVIS